MAIQYVGRALGVVNSTASATYNFSLTSLTGGIGTAPQAGDLIVVYSGFPQASDLNPGVTTAGYTEVADLYANDTRDANLSVSYRVADGSETSITVTGSNSASYGSATLVAVFRGVDTTTPLDATTTTATGTNAGLANGPAITPVTPGAWVITGGLQTGDTTPSVAFTGPSGFTEIGQVGATGTTSGPRIGVYYKSGWSSGAVDPTAWAGGESTTSDSWGAATLALRPAAVTGSASLSGSGTLAASGSYVWDGAAGLSGSSSLAASGSVAFSGAADLVGSGALSAGALLQSYSGYPKRITEDGNFRVTEDSLYRIDQSLSFVLHEGSASLAGSSALSAAGVRTAFGGVSLTATGILSVSATRSTPGIATLSGVASLAAAATRTTLASAGLSGAGSVSAAGTRTTRATVSLSAAGSLVASGSVVILAEADLSALGTLSAQSQLIFSGYASLSGSSAFSADAITYRIGKIYAKNGDQWREITPSVKYGGSWVVPQTVYVKTGGEWKRVFINGN